MHVQIHVYYFFYVSKILFRTRKLTRLRLELLMTLILYAVMVFCTRGRTGEVMNLIHFWCCVSAQLSVCHTSDVRWRRMSFSFIRGFLCVCVCVCVCVSVSVRVLRRIHVKNFPTLVCASHSTVNSGTAPNELELLW
jgi:hypothetical protein